MKSGTQVLSITKKEDGQKHYKNSQSSTHLSQMAMDHPKVWLILSKKTKDMLLQTGRGIEILIDWWFFNYLNLLSWANRIKVTSFFSSRSGLYEHYLFFNVFNLLLQSFVLLFRGLILLLEFSSIDLSTTTQQSFHIVNCISRFFGLFIKLD
jgi:hypothetical protein